MRSLWLAKKGGNSVALRIIPHQDARRVDFEIIENAKAKDVTDGTVARCKATCPVCGYTTPVQSVREQLRKKRGGTNDARMVCVVVLLPDGKKQYRLPRDIQTEAVVKSVKRLEELDGEWQGSIPLVPNEHLPIMSGVFNAPIYGHDTWGSLFPFRQALALVSLVRLLKEADVRGDKAFMVAVRTVLALAIDRQADYLSSLVVWSQNGEFVAHTFGRQALPMIMDFAEPNPWVNTSGNWLGAIDWICRCIERDSDSLIRTADVSKSLSY